MSGTMPASLSNTRPRPSISLGRDFLKCERCRREHKKCLPRRREWDGQGPKCERCERLGHTCGPMTRAPTRTSQSDGDGNAGNSRATQNPNSSTANDIRRVTGGTTRSPRPIATWVSEESTPALATAAAAISALELVTAYKHMLHNLGLNFNHDVRLQQKLKFVSRCLTSTTCNIETSFKKASMLIHEQVPSTQGPGLQILCWQMMFMCMRYDRLVEVNSNVEAPSALPGWSTWLKHISHDTTGACTLLCTSRVLCTMADTATQSSHRPNLKLQDYLTLESRIEDLIQRIEDADLDVSSPSSIDSETVTSRCAFPASHIAYLNQDPEVAFQIWERSPSRHYDVDALGRTFLHLVTAFQDVAMVRRMVTRYPDAVRLASPDHLGHYPLDIVIDPNARELHALLRSHGAQPSSELRRFSYRPSPQVFTQRAADEFPALRHAILSPGSPAPRSGDTYQHISSISAQQMVAESIYVTMSEPMDLNMDSDDSQGFEQVHPNLYGSSAAFQTNNSSPHYTIDSPFNAASQAFVLTPDGERYAASPMSYSNVYGRPM